MAILNSSYTFNVPYQLKPIYTALLNKLAVLGVDMLKDCNSSCSGTGKDILKCWNLFQIICGNINAGNKKEYQTLLKILLYECNCLQDFRKDVDYYTNLDFSEDNKDYVNFDYVYIHKNFDAFSAYDDFTQVFESIGATTLNDVYDDMINDPDSYNITKDSDVRKVSDVLVIQNENDLEYTFKHNLNTFTVSIIDNKNIEIDTIKILDINGIESYIYNTENNVNDSIGIIHQSIKSQDDTDKEEDFNISTYIFYFSSFNVNKTIHIKFKYKE